MKKTIFTLLLTVLFVNISAQNVPTASSSMQAGSWGKQVPFNVSDAGKEFQFATGMGGWSDEQFAMAQVLVSGIEFATLMTAGDPLPLETRISGAIRTILGIYGIPEDVCRTKLEKVFAMDYRNIGKKAFMDFRKFVEQSNEKAFRDLLKR